MKKLLHKYTQLRNEDNYTAFYTFDNLYRMVTRVVGLESSDILSEEEYKTYIEYYDDKVKEGHFYDAIKEDNYNLETKIRGLGNTCDELFDAINDKNEEIKTLKECLLQTYKAYMDGGPLKYKTKKQSQCMNKILQEVF
jgi:hypothetical protein